MKKSMLMLGAMLGCALVFAADPAKPAAPAAKPAAKADAKPAMKTITVEELTADLPDVLAKVNGRNVTKAQFIKDLKAQLPDGKLPPLPEDQAQMQLSQFRAMAPMAVQQYVDQMLMEQAAAKAGFKPSAEAVTKMFKDQIAKLPDTQKKMMEAQLQIQGKTVDGMIAEQAKKPEVQKMMALRSYVEKEVLSKIQVTDKEAQTFYDKNKAQFTEPADAADSVRASHILISVKEGASKEEAAKAEAKAKALIAQLQKDPKSFADVAKKESACPSGKQQGGSLGAFRKGEMVPEFEKAAGALKIGEMTKTPVKTAYGYHIIRRDALQGARTVPFAKVKDGIVNMLKGQKTQAAMQALVSRLEQDAKVQILVKPAAVPAAKPAAKK